MATIKISQLTAAAAATGTQELEVNESGTSKKITGAQLASYIEGEVSSSPSFTGQVSLAAGTVSAPSITTTGDTNTGIYFPAADTIAFTEGGTEAMRIDSSGNVGIGTTTPSGYLTRVAAVAPGDYGASFVAVSNGSAANWARIDLKNTNVATNTYWHKDQVGVMGLVNEGAHAMYFGTNNTERMRIDSSGNVGIGTSSPSARFDVRHSENTVAKIKTTGAGSYGALQISNSNTNGEASIGFRDDSDADAASWVIGKSVGATDAFGFYYNGTKMLIDTSGNVGIGTSSPGARLTLGGGATDQYINREVNNGALILTGGTGITGGLASAGLALRGETSSYNVKGIEFYTNGAERMRIDASGNVGIGGAPSYALDVKATTGQVIVASTTGTNYARYLVANTGGTIQFGIDNSTGTNFGSGAAYSRAIFSDGAYPICVYTNGTERMRVDASGNVGIGTSTFGTSAAKVLSIGTGTAPSTGPADTIQIFSTDLSAGNTILSLRTEGTPVNANTTAAATHRIAVRINGTVYYLLANTAA